MEVNLESLLKYMRSYETSNHFKSTLYKHSFTTNEGKFETTLKKIGTSEFKRKTNLSIGGFLPVSPGPPLIVRSIQLTDFLCIISYCWSKKVILVLGSNSNQ